MNRRSFLETLIAVPLAAIFIPEKSDPLEVFFDYDKLYTYRGIGLEGIPYHQSNASTGSWLGFDRSHIPQNSKEINAKLGKMIELMKKDKLNNPLEFYY